MPIYEYRCKACGNVTEVMQKINDRPLRKCKECAGRLEKLISRTSFQLKGGGWYDQGYSKGSGGSGGSSSSASKSGSSKSSGSSKKKSSSGDSSSSGSTKASAAV